MPNPIENYPNTIYNIVYYNNEYGMQAVNEKQAKVLNNRSIIEVFYTSMPTKLRYWDVRPIKSSKEVSNKTFEE